MEVKTIIEYGVATANNHEELAGFVNQQIRQGWQPFGNVFITEQYNQLFIHQPMVLYEIKKKSKT